MIRRRLLESTCSDCGGTVPDADHFDRDNAENATGIPLCHCHTRKRPLRGDRR